MMHRFYTEEYLAHEIVEVNALGQERLSGQIKSILSNEYDRLIHNEPK